MRMNGTSTKLVPAAGLGAWTGLLPESAENHGWRMRLMPALLIFALWTVVGLFQAVPDMLDGFRWTETIGKFIDAWAWALLTPAILLIDRKLTSRLQNVVRIAVAHLGLSIPFSLAHTYLTGLILYPMPDIWWSPLRSTEFAIYFYLGGWGTYAAIVGVLQTFKYYNRFMGSQVELARVEKNLVESHLNALRLQLEPHFLFNTLNAISSELAANPVLAREMIEDLAALLRQSLDCQGSREITLAQELALLDHYLAIQKLRFGERIDICVEVDPATHSAMVPSMFLQPLVENAIRHGLEGRMSGGKVVVSAAQVGAALHIAVIDDGVGLPRQWTIETCAGLGIGVTRERLQTLYPEPGDHDFRVARREGGGTEVAIRIPLHRMGAEARGVES
ncbi:two-component sensor histidine kinase [Sphingomonas naasensis]|uniref:Sensor histidine kinase n=1 Tax=Sphingomonas naasensis TaxID=1344951 RepID=A0A4S1WSM0_9SPHN|nr:histidine kinase [Sphingomonas naasensis]NIJ18826.1 two-component sensor histidine kinase [Sphingomonas naasensis]TGX46053.1 sensor histidine kinase [Sphingomonas naasensis]